jgi:Flp pilus assembly secretin CpaC
VVLSNDRISLQVQTEVSEISTEQTLQLPGITVPSFNVRRAETTIELSSGGSLMLAGLIESQAIRTMNEVPGLNKVPIIGDLISSESFQRNESELIVMMTAYTVKPFSENKDIQENIEDKTIIQEIYLDRNPLKDILKKNLQDAAKINADNRAALTEKINNTNYIID